MEGDLDMHVQGASAGSGLAWSWFAVGLVVQLGLDWNFIGPQRANGMDLGSGHNKNIIK